jgi:hypothetical protein
VRHVTARQLQHCGRRVGRNYPVTTLEQVPRQVAASAAELDHQSIAFPDRRQQIEHSTRARVRMESESQVVHAR